MGQFLSPARGFLSQQNTTAQAIAWHVSTQARAKSFSVTRSKVRTEVHFLNKRGFPLPVNVTRKMEGRLLAREWGWHLLDFMSDKWTG